MYIAMNRFQVTKGSEAAFEDVWTSRDSSLADVPGFIEFRLLRGKENAEEGFTLYASHSLWRTEDDFINWTKSDNFRAAHRSAADHRSMYKGPPVFEGFRIVEGA